MCGDDSWCRKGRIRLCSGLLTLRVGGSEGECGAGCTIFRPGNAFVALWEIYFYLLRQFSVGMGGGRVRRERGSAQHQEGLTTNSHCAATSMVMPVSEVRATISGPLGRIEATAPKPGGTGLTAWRILRETFLSAEKDRVVGTPSSCRRFCLEVVTFSAK